MKGKRKNGFNRLEIDCSYPYSQSGIVRLNGKEVRDLTDCEIKIVNDGNGVPVFAARLNFYCALSLKADVSVGTSICGAASLPHGLRKGKTE